MITLFEKYFLLIFILTVLLLTACRPKEITISPDKKLALIPQPKTLEKSNLGLDLVTLNSISVPKTWSELNVLFNEFHKKNDLDNIKVGNKKNASAIKVIENKNLLPEAYILNVKTKDVIIESSDYAGAYNAFQTWKQIVMQAENNIIMQVKIKDSPKFAYRGLMIDCSRHFWNVQELKDVITQMSFYKLNKLHLHLTDNNAWRVQINAYPKLITKGTYYKDYPELSDKFYTQKDLKEIVAFAKKYNIEVIPEIDLPGHAIGIMAAYPELACTAANETFEVYPEEMPLTDRKPQATMLCAGNEKVYEFAETVIKELSEVFPSDKFHLGGDEVPTTVWEKCERCKILYHKENLKEWGELQDYFTRKMSAIAQKNGKTMLGWDEINERHAATANDMIMVWRNHGYPQAFEAMQRNVPIIMAPQHPVYFDWGYAGNSVRKVYEWNPISEEMNALNKNDLVLGGQACLWTERVPTQERLEYMLYPRLTTLAEVLWSPKDHQEWDGFLQRLVKHYPIMEKLGINYYKDDAINEKEFKPGPEKPALVRHANLSSSLPGFDNYHLEYIFDGRSNTFYWGGRGLSPNDWYQIDLGEPVNAKNIRVITGDSKDYIENGDLLVSEDGTLFSKVASFDEFGVAEGTLSGDKIIKAIRIEVTKEQTAWPIIKEVVIE